MKNELKNLTGQEIYQYYQGFRDYSGNKIDSYSQDLQTYYWHSILNGEIEPFFNLLKDAENQGKMIDYSDMGNLVFDDYYVELMILKPKNFIIK